MFEYLIFPDEIKGFSRPEYLIVLISFVYGFSLSDQFYHFSLMIRRRVFYFETIIWSNLLMLLLIIYWYLLWRNVEKVDDSLYIFILNFLPGIMLFILISLLYPSETEGTYDPKKTFIKNRRWIFFFCAMFIMSIMLSSLLINGYYTPLNYFRTIHLILFLLCVFFDSLILRLFTATWLFVWFNVLIFYLKI